MKRFAVIPTNGREVLFEAITAIATQVDKIFVVEHRAGIAVSERLLDLGVTCLPYHEDPPNISQMWNNGLRAARYHSGYDPHQVAVINDDAIVPPGWFDAVSQAMDEYRCGAGSTDQYNILTRPEVFTKAEPVDMYMRMSGFAFILDQSAPRLDEQFKWWYGDDDLEWRARQEVGVVRVPGHPVDHRHPGVSTTGQLADIAGEDRQRFIAKWGKAPH